MKRLPKRSLTYWGILAVEATSKNQEDCPEDGIHLQRLAWDDTVTSHGYCVSVHISIGAIPLLPPVYNMEAALPVKVEVPSIGVCRSPSLIELKIHDDLAQLYQRGWNKLPTRRFVPMKFKKKTLYPRKYYLSNQTPRASGRPPIKARVQYFYNYGWWRTHTSCECRCSQEILCQKNKSSISHKPKKTVYAKNERLGGLKTRKGGPGKN